MIPRPESDEAADDITKTNGHRVSKAIHRKQNLRPALLAAISTLDRPYPTSDHHEEQRETEKRERGSRERKAKKNFEKAR